MQRSCCGKCCPLYTVLEFHAEKNREKDNVMVILKRLIIATLMGGVCGLFCYWAAILMFGLEIPDLNAVYIILSRILIGFVIGISALDMHWAKHGLLIGLIIGLPFPLFDIIIGQKWYVVGGAFIMGPIFGLFIEFVTSKIFNAPVLVSAPVR
jgi:hypothetical protein